MSSNFCKYSVSLSMRIGLLCLIFAMGSATDKLNAQPIPVDDVRDTQYRLLQLLSDSTIQTSLVNRPLWHATYNTLFEQNSFDGEAWWGQPIQTPDTVFSLLDYEIQVGAYEPVATSTFNSKLPYGENNGAAWYGRGLTTELQGGFYVTSDYFTVTLRPHLFQTQNKDFIIPRFIPRYPDGSVRYVAEGILPEDTLAERIDRPFRFGPDSFTTLDWGQSSARLHYKAVEVGLSNENLWWGPGNQYALMLSNNAPGLKHLFLGSRQPIQLPLNIGNLELRWIFGWPDDSEFFDLNIHAFTAEKKIKARLQVLNSTRIMNGLNVVYTPSFLPNLSVGLSRIIHQYVPDGGLSVGNDILGIFKAFPKPDNEVLKNPHDDSHFEEKNPIASVFFRWVWPESNAEFYGELYKGDHNVNLRDFLMEPQHGRAYTIGIQKLLEFDGFIDFVQVNAEINNLLPGRIDDVRPQTFIYTHKIVKQGHTNNGQILGAAIGPGSTSEYLGVNAYFNKGKLGLFAQRVVENDHFHFERQERFFPGGGFKDQFHHRENLNLGINGAYKIGPVLLNGKFTWNRNFNYGRFDLGERAFYTTPIDIVDNFQYQLSVRYLF